MSEELEVKPSPQPVEDHSLAAFKVMFAWTQREGAGEILADYHAAILHRLSK